jgi:MFS family permease
VNRNINLFIAFRLLFNARYYYPVFAVIQLDYGLTLAQFAVLNAVWAASIVLLEVPSGALADRVGRKRMVLAAAVLMVLEMALLAFVPLGNNPVVFWVWVVNRICSGAAEASASGADEALAYDSVPKEERSATWPRVLTRLMTLSSLAFIVAMLIGAAVYDPALVNRALAALGSGIELSKETVIRFPVYLTLFNALLATIVAWCMKEPEHEAGSAPTHSLWSGIAKAGAWIWRTPAVLVLILAALVFDSPVRLFLTLNSEYYRLIQIPDAAFGLIGAAFAGLGLIVPRIAEWLVRHRTPGVNYTIVAALGMAGFLGVAQAWPHYGVLVVVCFSASFGLLNFFTSHYLNAEVDSAHRATVLSFKGLALNIGFGAVSLGYGVLLKLLRNGDAPGAVQAAFRASLHWLPWVFLVSLIPLATYWRWRVKSPP